MYNNIYNCTYVQLYNFNKESFNAKHTAAVLLAESQLYVKETVSRILGYSDRPEVGTEQNRTE